MCKGRWIICYELMDKRVVEVRRHGNTLFVTTQGAYLSKERETLLVRVEGKTRLRLPIHTIGNVVCYGQVSCSPAAMGFCAERGVTLTFMTERGRFLARVEGPISGNVLLRRRQYRVSDDLHQAAEVARMVVVGKIANSRVVLQRHLRDHVAAANSGISGAIKRLANIVEKAREPLGLDQVRGLEGEAARVYFGVFDGLVVAQRDHFKFQRRSRRPPLDPINALLSFLYAVLLNDVRSACESVGLDPSVGFLHRDRPGRPSLALDLMEEFRALIADRLVLTLINRQQVSSKGFLTTETGGVVMDENTRKGVLVAYQKRKQAEVTHHFLDEKITIGLLPQIQGRLLARYLRGDLDSYPPFFWR